MQIERFDMERAQCLYENEVRYNLSESGVMPLTLEEVLGAEGIRKLAAQRIKYPPSTGSPALREYIADFYDNAAPENVQVVNGGAEANFITLWGLLEPGDRFAFMIPAYLQGLGLGRAWTRRTDTFQLKVRGSGANRRWALDRDGLKKAVGKTTRAIFVTNPNNPSGGVLDEDEMQFIVDTARRAGAWIIADEIYRGAELNGPMSPTFWGRYEKVIVTSGLSKAFALPGLRVGWILGPAATLRKLAHYHDYTTLTPNYLSERIATTVMEPRHRSQVLARTRAILRANLPKLERWIHSHDDIFDYVPPLAGAITFVKYRLPIASETLFNRLRTEYSVLVTPGAHFGLGKYLRIGYGYDIDETLKALKQTEPLLKELRRK